MPEAFYVADGDGWFDSTEWTIGPWETGSQHAGPPAALLGWAAERAHGRDDMQVVRGTFEILRPVPVARVHVGTEVIRPGRSVTLVGAVLSDEHGPVVDARFWCVRQTSLDLEEVIEAPAAPPGPDSGSAVELFPSGDRSYLHALEWRFVRGGFVEPGPATAWARMRHALVEGHPVDPLARALVLADSGNGISAALDFSRWLFINPDLTVYLDRMPVGEWVCLEAATTLRRTGNGLASSVLYDSEGPLGRGMQSLFVARR